MFMARDLTIWANKIEVALFIGMHCRYATMLSLQEFDVKKMDDHVIDIFRKVRKELGVRMPKDARRFA